MNSNAAKTVWSIDPAHSTIGFSIKHMMIAKVRGAFEKVSGELVHDAANPSASKVEAVIEAASINTREAQRDGHLRSPDFFDVEKFPTITFKSKKFEANGDGGLDVIGDLQIHGVVKEVRLAVDGPTQELKDPWGNSKIGASAQTKIKRKDFGLTWNAALEAGGVLVGDEVSIELDLQFVKKAA